jgi:Predicted dehydrogenases and related proteins
MKLRLALVGCGKVAERHLKILKALAEEVEVVGVADVNPERVNLFAKELNCKAYTDFRELIKKEDPEVVDLAVPSGLHGQMWG